MKRRKRRAGDEGQTPAARNESMERAAARRWLCVSLHDVAPATWSRCCRVLAAVQEVADVPVTLLVVPALHGTCSADDPTFVAALDECHRRGHELVLHGYFHEDPGTPDTFGDWIRRRVLTAGEGEFAALDEREAAERIRLGRAWFAAQGWPVEGFVPPAWLMSTAARRALHGQGFSYTTSLHHLHLLQEGRAVPAPCVTYSTRSWLRRSLSCGHAASVVRATRHMPLVRLALHPQDADYRSVRRSWQRHLARWLDDRWPVTKRDAVQLIRGFAGDRGRLPALQAPVSVRVEHLLSS